jgi:hypothetical protein
VTVRQHPEAAKGAMFVSLEDETGNVQVDRVAEGQGEAGRGAVDREP